MYVLSQILVVVSDILCILSMLNKKKKNIVFFLFLSTVFFACHYLCLKGWTGAAIAFIELVFLIVLYILESKNKTKYNKHLSIITIAITVIISILTWGTWISALPMTAMIVYLAGLMFKNVILVKSLTFIRLTLNGVYMLLLKSYFGAVLTIVILIFTIIGIVQDSKNKKIIKSNRENPNKLIFREVDNSNKNLAIKLQATIFPNEKSPNQVGIGIKTGNPKNYIVYDNKTPVGIVGYYTNEYLKEHILINWFGVLEEHRKNGYGTQILQWLISVCKKKEPCYLTTYTDKIVNFESTKLYKKLGFEIRDYKNKEEINKLNKLGIKNNYVICMYKLKPCKDIDFEYLNLQVYNNLMIIKNNMEKL